MTNIQKKKKSGRGQTIYFTGQYTLEDKVYEKRQVSSYVAHHWASVLFSLQQPMAGHAVTCLAHKHVTVSPMVYNLPTTDHATPNSDTTESNVRKNKTEMSRKGKNRSSPGFYLPCVCLAWLIVSSSSFESQIALWFKAGFKLQHVSDAYLLYITTCGFQLVIEKSILHSRGNWGFTSSPLDSYVINVC